ncbi:hypothetical protein, partial [Endozoicomonas sp. ALC013]|uniref:hypothetical protein n=1 Tax=Endozoicomonas sp. ALC013 TaxID=3403076 RepID=UPI003BB6228E
MVTLIGQAGQVAAPVPVTGAQVALKVIDPCVQMVQSPFQGQVVCQSVAGIPDQLERHPGNRLA